MQDAVSTIAATTAAGRPADGVQRWRLVARNVFPFAVVGTIWEIVAWMGIFPHRLFPTLEEVALSFVQKPSDVIEAKALIGDRAGLVAKIEKRVWELLGLSADPQLDYDLALTGDTVGTAAGSVSLRVRFTGGY